MCSAANRDDDALLFSPSTENSYTVWISTCALLCADDWQTLLTERRGEVSQHVICDT